MEEVTIQGQSGGIGALAASCSDEVRRSIESVTYDGVAEGLEMDPDLVGAAGFNFYFDEREGSMGGGEPFQNGEVGAGGTTVRAAGRHAGAANEIPGDREFDGNVVLCQVAVGEGEVGFVNLAGLEHLAELPVGAVVLGDDDGSGGLLVEAVDDAGALVSGSGGELIEVEEDGIDEGAAVAGRRR